MDFAAARRSRSTSSPIGRTRRRLSSFVSALAAVLLLAGSLVAGGFAAPAAAAGSAQVSVSVTAVDPTTGTPITSTSPGQYGSKVAFRVDFSCLSAACTNATVKLDPTQLDPIHNQYRLLVAPIGFTAPLTGGTYSGTDATGYTVSLGNLTAGQSGSFTFQYSQPNNGTYVAYANEVSPWLAENFPDGFQISLKATGNADTASAPISATSSPVRWNITAADPAAATLNLPGRANVGTNYTYNVAMGNWCTQASANYVTGNAHVCADSYTVTHHIPAGVQFVSAAGNPTVTGSVATGWDLVWNSPAWAATTYNNYVVNPEAGWLLNTIKGNTRTVTVSFPASSYAPAGTTCNFDAQSGKWTTKVDVTYLSMPGTPGEKRSATATSGTTEVSCWDPFGKAVADPKSSTQDSALTNGDSLITVPAAGSENLKYWQVTVGNQANVPGVAVVTDNALDQANAPVYQIKSIPTGATVVWTATNGTNTISGTSTTPVSAPAGYRFVTSKVTSTSLAAPNQYPDAATARTNFVVQYLYRVTSEAPGGEKRTNTASAVMTYPGYPNVADIPLTIAPKSIVFNGPFARGRVEKSYGGSGTWGGDGTAKWVQHIPDTGAATGKWNVSASNTGNNPATLTVTESDLASGPFPVYKIDAGTTFVSGCETPASASRVTINYTLDDGTTGSVVSAGYSASYTAPAGRKIVAATAIAPGVPASFRVDQPNTGGCALSMQPTFDATKGASTPGPWTNTASGSIAYPGFPSLTTVTGTASATVRFIQDPPVVVPAVFRATITRDALPAGQTTAGPNTNVTFRVGGSTASVPTDRDITPQYVFVAPVGWQITPGSAAFPAGSVPVGVTYSYRTVTISGVARQIVVASWPAGTVFGKNTTLPTMSVVAHPGTSVTAGTVGTPSAYIGNTGTPVANDNFVTPFTDAPDMDADSNTTEQFATANNAGTGTTVAAVPGLQVLKEICQPDSSQADGCNWYSDPSNSVGVPPNSTSIKYRLTVTNTGNTTLSDVVGYDVLPYIGDTGTSDATGSTARGSTFRETLQSVGTPTNSATATYSPSTQPCRSEVDSTVPGCASNWSSASSGAQAIRLARAGSFAAGASFSMQYTAAVLNAPANGAIACNSFAVKVTGLSTVSEPAPVCATVAETDLRVVAGTPKLQKGRPGVLPYTVTNLGGAASTRGTVSVSIPAGLTATNFSPTGWTCTATKDGSAVYGTAVGAATLTCTPTDPLLLNTPVALNVPVEATTTSAMSSTADVKGLLYDGNTANNEDTMSISPLAAPGDIGVVKDDGVSQASPGDTLTYSIAVTNPLATEVLPGAVVTDTLPAGLSFVSASNGGTAASGVVTWNLADLPAGGSTTVSVTVKVLSSITGASIVNTATVSAPDPADSTATLTGSGDDTDLLFFPAPSLEVTKASTTTAVTRVGQQVPYTFEVKNTGNVPLSNVSVTDTVGAPSTQANLTAVSCPTGAVAPGATVTCTATYTTTQADLDHLSISDQATAAGTPPATQATPNPEPVVSQPSPLTIPVTAAPALTVDKSSPQVSTPPTAVGQQIQYDFLVRNTGNLTVDTVSVTDTQIAPASQASLSTVTCPTGPLAPGEQTICTATYSVTQADVDNGAVSDKAVATAHSADPDTPVVTSPEDELTIPAERAPSIEVVKSSTTTLATEVGQQIPYTFDVHNSGNVTLASVSVTDVLTAPSSPADLSAISCPLDILIPGESTTCTATYTVTQADLDAGSVSDQATATAVPAAAAGDPTPTPITSPPSAVTIPVGQAPSVSVVKASTTTAITKVGERIPYTFDVTNEGNVSLTGIAVTDTVEAPSTQSNLSVVSCPTGAVAPGETVRCTATYTTTQADLDNGSVSDHATAAGTPAPTAVDPDPQPVVSDPSAVTIPVTARAGLAIDKNSSTTSVTVVGQQVAYTFVVTNTGNQTIHDVSVTDTVWAPSVQANLSPVVCPVTSLAAGQSVTCSAVYVATAADLSNRALTDSATAGGTSANGDPVVSDGSTLSLPATPPSVMLPVVSG